jgi:hypothetical protein
MTQQRPYRLQPLSTEQAIAELRKYAGIQFDPIVVDAFVKTSWAEGVPDPGRFVPPRPVPLIAQAASRMAQAVARDAAADPRGDPSGPASGGPTGPASADAS